MREYTFISRIISTLDQKLLGARTDLRYKMCLVDGIFSTNNKDAWAEVEMLNSEASLALDTLGFRLREMRQCLDEWNFDYRQALDEIGRLKAPTQKDTTQATRTPFIVETGDLRERQRLLAARRSTKAVSARERLRVARGHLLELKYGDRSSEPGSDDEAE